MSGTRYVSRYEPHWVIDGKFRAPMAIGGRRQWLCLDPTVRYATRADAELAVRGLKRVMGKSYELRIRRIVP